MVKIILGCLVLAMALTVGCDEEKDPRFARGCRFPDEFPEFQECPEEAFMGARVCDSYLLEIEGIDSGEVRLLVALADCEFPDCFTMDCEFTERDRNTREIIAIHNGVFDLETFPMGLVNVDGEDPVEYRAFVMVP